ncbi:hypothetical protein Hanom_Chr15g01361181 [Helianthus anomalus]
MITLEIKRQVFISFNHSHLTRPKFMEIFFWRRCVLFTQQFQPSYKHITCGLIKN